MKSMANTLFENGPPIADPRPSSTALWQRYRAAGPGDSSEEELVKQYLSLVKTVAGRLAITLPAHVSGEDLYSAGLVGLLSAVRRFVLFLVWTE